MDTRVVRVFVVVISDDSRAPKFGQLAVANETVQKNTLRPAGPNYRPADPNDLELNRV